ncbi:ATP-dependent protease ClpP, protease subunit [Streptosporangium canum]|uniref:ATP-dependent Clp protease proteolytic subunit n=1 Tax=Streptosporangium canum TaxID=324952 RepID=A0A1I4DHK0_9ACTN|nr:head maturation protease, ClpP-related [Streptosporangium canum]SFK92543.1 ATP-dependent protease ClpP, protease subunit [Streptosporangium canum]
MRLKTARPTARLRQGRNDWYRITNLADGAAEVVIYDEIGFWGVTAADFIRDLKAVAATEITLRVNSPGGDVFDGIAIHNVLRNHPATVTTHVDSLAASIASVIALAGDRIIMQPHSQMMIHDAAGMCIGNGSDMHDMAAMLDRQSDNIAAVYVERAGGTLAEWRERMRAETWMSADEAVAAGLADEVAPRRDTDTPAATNSWDLSIFNYAGREHAPPPILATAQDPAPETPPVEPAAGPTPTPEGEAPMPALDEGLRERLGLNADADEATILAAVDEALAERAEPETTPAPAAEPVAAQLPEGTVLVDSERLAQLERQAAEGVAARAQQRIEARDRDLDDAVRAGKFPPARREHWARLYDADPDGTRQTLNSLAEGTIPLADIGAPGGDEDTNGDAEFDRMFPTYRKGA